MIGDSGTGPLSRAAVLGFLGRALRTGAGVGVLAAAGVFAWRGSWPWRRLEIKNPIVVAESFVETVDTLRRGETLSDLLARHDVQGIPIPGMPRELSFDPRKLRAGLVFHFRRETADSTPSRIVVRTGPDHRLQFVRQASGWTAEQITIPWQSQPVRLDGSIDASLYEALEPSLYADLFPPAELVRLAWDLADVYAWEIDFTRDIRPGDHYSILAEREVNDEGEVRFGRILAGDLTIGGRRFSAFRFEDAQGRDSYYDENGNSLHRAFLLAPLQFRRVSSRFSSARLHPILGLVRRHEGTDFAASPGTPVRAAGDGTVTMAGWTEGYGYMVEIRHLNGITTRYGHLEGFAARIRRGVRVAQGETIGYVGSTGLATGPHLHYEFRVNGVARDPRSVQLRSGDPVEPGDRTAFERERNRLTALLADSEPPITLGAE